MSTYKQVVNKLLQNFVLPGLRQFDNSVSVGYEQATRCVAQIFTQLGDQLKKKRGEKLSEKLGLIAPE